MLQFIKEVAYEPSLVPKTILMRAYSFCTHLGVHPNPSVIAPKSQLLRTGAMSVVKEPLRFLCANR